MLGYLNFGWKQKMCRWSINFDQLLISDDVVCSAGEARPRRRSWCRLSIVVRLKIACVKSQA